MVAALQHYFNIIPEPGAALVRQLLQERLGRLSGRHVTHDEAIQRFLVDLELADVVSPIKQVREELAVNDITPPRPNKVAAAPQQLFEHRRTTAAGTGTSRHPAH